MAHYLLDACALVNLYCGWGGISELTQFGDSWAIGEIALGEAIFVRDFDGEGNIRKLTLDPKKVLADGRLQLLSVTDERESSSFVEFAMDLDDGEAQALALAMHRNRVVVTDDRPAVRVAGLPKNSIAVTGTPEILMAWVKANPAALSRLPEVIRRVSVLGPFQLRKNSPHYTWWQDHLP